MLRVALTASVIVFLSIAAPARAAPEKPAKLVVIGIDGVSLNLLRPFINKGVTPNLGALAKAGASGDLPSIWPLRTPQVWTTVVTGKLPGQHGIWDHASNTYFNPPGVRTKEKINVTSDARKSAALWSLLGKEGLRTLTVGWMASWPAESVPNGVMVAPIRLSGDKRQTTIKGSFYRGSKRMVSPARHEKRVQKLIVDPASITNRDLKPFADVPTESSFYKGLPYLERYVYGLRWSLARARSVEAITVGLAKDTQPDVVLSYFQCPDSLLHRFWIFHTSPDGVKQRLETHGLPSDRSAELHRRFGRVIEACYRDVDERVGRILEATRGPDTTVLIVSDHGFGYAPIPHLMKGEPYSGDHLDDGVILASGPGIAAGSALTNATVVDITPTLLHRLGYSVAKDMRGRVLPALAGNKPVKWIPTYESAPQTEAVHADGWPPRKKPRRTVSEQIGRFKP